MLFNANGRWEDEPYGPFIELVEGTTALEAGSKGNIHVMGLSG